MAAVTRDNALAQVRRTIVAYRDRMHDVHCDTDYLPPEGAQIVNEYCSFDNDQQDLVLKSLGNPLFLDAMDDRLLLEYCTTCMDLDEVLGLDSWHIGKVDSIIGVADLSRSEKIKKAIEYSDVLNEILEEIGDINILVAQMAVVSGILIGLAATGYGAVAEALGFVLLAVGAAFSGTDLLAGIIGLARFFTMVDDAKSDEDLKNCGRLFGDAVAKIGVDGLFFALSMFGLKKASARLTTKTVVDNGLNSRKWKGKRIPEKIININEEPPVKRIEKQAEVKFKIKEKFNTIEYKRQLKNQEDRFNKMTIQEYLNNVENYKNNGRGAEATKVQKQVRNVEKIKKVFELRREGYSSEDAEKLAEEWIKTQSALHNPDMSAGGNPLDVTEVGDARINSSIGSQWGNGNAELLESQIKDSIKSIDSKEYTTTYLNVKLTSE